MYHEFSAKHRGQELLQIAKQPADLLIIGGGITGAGIAWDAAQRGLRTALVEMRDFAWGTSSRSTKLIHGGLRYLKQGEIKLVMEVGRERALLHRIAPHLVVPEPMLLPLYRGGTYGYLASAIGLYIYDLLAGVKRGERRIMLTKEQAAVQEPLLRRQGLIGAGCYYEYRTDDARLTMDVLKTARSHGAQLVNYACAEEFVYDGKRIVGARISDQLSGELHTVYAHAIVNASGPWVDQVRSKDHEIAGKRLLLTKGVHLVVDYTKLPVRQAAYIDVPDGRMIFVIPREGKTYIGTTDTVYEGSIEEAPRASSEDRDYLLEAVNSAFDSVNLLPIDVESSWAGLRPLIHQEGKGPSEISRRDELFVSDSGLITIAGGKLTGFRKMAEKVVDRVVRRLSADGRTAFTRSATSSDTISGGDVDGYADFAGRKQELLAQGQRCGIHLASVEELVNRYGSNAAHIFDEYTALSEFEREQLAVLYAELKYCIKHEMTVHAVDFLVRRTGLLYFDRPRAERISEAVLQLMSFELDWTEQEIDRQRQQLHQEIKAAAI